MEEQYTKTPLDLHSAEKLKITDGLKYYFMFRSRLLLFYFILFYFIFLRQKGNVPMS